MIKIINPAKKLVFLLGLFFYLPSQTNAWGLLGHRIIGQIAESHLTPSAKNEIAKILGIETIAISSNWADFIKSDTSMSYLSPWHYIDMDGGLSSDNFQSYLKQDTATDAYTKLNFLIKELKNKSLPQDTKSVYLKLLIHIVGDVHQPLHIGHHDDEGGNKIKVSWMNTPANLHQVWDYQLINYQQLSYTEYTDAINHTTKVQRAEWQKQPISEWIYESYQIAQNIYDDIKPDDKLSYRYNYKYIDILNQQLLKGGIRLAGLLNEIFGS